MQAPTDIVEEDVKARPPGNERPRENQEAPQPVAEEEASVSPDARPSRRLLVLAYLIAILAPLITGGLYYQATRVAGVDVGFPLDDSWIHAQYSRTIVEGRPFEYVEGERSMGSTSVLFDVVWAAATMYAS